MMEKWYLTKEFGQLYKEIDLVYGNEPVLFVCQDRDKSRYLCMTYESAESNYVIIQASPMNLIKMLENKITMEDTFRRAGSIFWSEEGNDEDSLSLVEYSSSSFPAGKLPEKGEYYELDFEWVKDYIRQLKSEMHGLEFAVPYQMPDTRQIRASLNVEFKISVPEIAFESVVDSHEGYKASYKMDRNLEERFNSSTGLDNQAA